MVKKKKIKLLILGILILTTGSLAYEFFFGKLFVFSPVTIGFTEHELNNTIIYTEKGSDYKDFLRIDSLTPAVEKFHELKFKKKPEIYIFNDSVTFVRRSFSKARFSAYPTGRLLVSPWAIKEDKEGKISLEIYIRHELSHVLLMQYMSFFRYYHYPEWLMEGVAVYSTHQMGTSFYPGKEETYHDIAMGNFLPPMDFKTNREEKTRLNVKNPIAFQYSEFACIVDYLVITYGKEKLLIFMKKLFENSDNNVAFQETYSIEFSKMIQDFKNYIKESEMKI